MTTALAPEIGTRAPPARPGLLDVVMGVLAVVLVTGFFIDLRAHGRVNDTFFTPWHGILYAGALLGWSIHMILGAPLMAGAVGLLMSLLVFRPEVPAVSEEGRYP